MEYEAVMHVPMATIFCLTGIVDHVAALVSTGKFTRVCLCLVGYLESSQTHRHQLLRLLVAVGNLSYVILTHNL